MSKRDCIVYEDSNSHWVHHVEWWCYVPSQEEKVMLAGAGYVLDMSDMLDEQFDTGAYLTWSKDAKITAEFVNDLVNLETVYESYDDIPRKELDKVLGKHGFVTPSEYSRFYRRAWIHGFAEYLNESMVFYYNGNMITGRPKQIINVDDYISYGKYDLGKEALPPAHIVLASINVEHAEPFDGVWSNKRTGVYTENGVQYMNYDNLISGGYLDGPHEYGRHYLNFEKMATLEGVLVFNMADLPENSFYLMDNYVTSTYPYINKSDSLDTVNDKVETLIERMPVNNGITGIVFVGSIVFDWHCLFANYLNCKFIDMGSVEYIGAHGTQAIAGTFVNFPKLEKIITPIVTSVEMHYSFLPENNVVEIDDTNSDYNHESATTINDMKAFLKYTKYVQENGYTGLKLSEYINQGEDENE